jgi:hypothetical protein
MAVPASPSVGSRALYYSYVTPAPAVPVQPTGLGSVTPAPGVPNFGFSPVVSSIPPDVGVGGLPLPATVLSVAGSAPDYSGSVFLVFTPNGNVVRSANFTSAQPLLNSATWASQGSNAAQARWSLVDALA